MKIKEYMKKVKNLEERKYVPGEDFIELLEEYENAGLDTDGLFTLTNQQKAIFDRWKSQLGDDSLDGTVFTDKTFLMEFLKSIPEEEQFNYVKNTANYETNSLNGYDPNYVIVTRRAVPSLEAKPEQFWSTEHREVLMGLTQEIPHKSAQREHSVIMVSTLGNVQKHGTAMHWGGFTDGEIVTSSKPFSEDEMLFVYKPINELYSFCSYMQSGGIKNEEILKILRDGAIARTQKIKLSDIDSLKEVEDSTGIPRKGQTMAITPDQVEQKRKEEQSKNRANEERIKMSSLKSDISSSKIRDSEAVQSQEEIKEIKNRRSLLFRAKMGSLTPEEQEKLDMLNAKYGEKENTQTQSKGQRKGNGRGR